MTLALCPYPRFRAFDVGGLPLAGGKLYAYAAGTSTPQALLAADGTTPLAHPVVLDGAGCADVRLGASAYKLNLLSALDVQQAGWPVDNVTNPTTVAGFDDYSATVAQMRLSTDPGEVGTESQATTLSGELERLRYAIQETKEAINPASTYWYETPTRPEWVNVKSYGAVGDGVTSDRTAIQNAFNAACAAGGSKTVFFPPGSYFCGTNGGSTNIIDLSALGDGIGIRTSGFVELVNTCTTGHNMPRFFYLANNSFFFCDPIAFRDTNYDASEALATAGDNQGAVGFYVQNATPANWGKLFFTRIVATTMTSAFICAQKTGAAATSASRIKDIFIGQLIANDTYYGTNWQNDGDNVVIGHLHANQCRRPYYCYGVSNHVVTILDTNPRGSTGKCYIARQVAGLNTTGLDIRYRSRNCNLAGTTLVAIDHIDHAGGDIAGITVDVDVKDSAAAYTPVRFRNYLAGVDSAAPSANYTRDIRLSGSCDANATAVTSIATYAAQRLLHFVPGYNFLPDQGIYNAFQMAQSARGGAPVWGGDTTAPELQNGTISYSLDLLDGVAFVAISVLMGAATTYGSGSWYFQIPGLVATHLAVGACFYFDAGTTINVGVCKIEAASSSIYCYANAAATGVRATVPFTWAVSDKLQLSIAFPVAS